MTSMRTATCESEAYCTALYNNYRSPVTGGAKRKVASFDQEDQEEQEGQEDHEYQEDQENQEDQEDQEDHF